jgi:tetratricopeptide (TPR) repeat protein
VPDDVFIVTGARHNPDRQFLDEYWAGVWNQFMDSGVPTEAFELVMGLADEGQRAEFARLETRFGDLCAAIDWEALGAGQFVFAERLHPPIAFGDGPAVTSQPDLVFLLRTDPELARRSHDQLVALMEAAIEEINTLAGLQLTTRPATLHGVSFTVFDMLQAVSEAPELPLAIGRHDDVLVATFGAGMDGEVAALLTGAEGHRSIADDPRFQKAFAELPAPEDAFEFVDIQNLREDFGSYAEGILTLVRHEMGGGYEDRITNARQDDEATLLSRQGYAAYEQGDYDRALKLTEAAHEVDPGDTVVLYNLACLNALLGNRELACEWLGKAVAGGFHAPDQIAADGDLSSVRGEPAYKEALGAAREAAQGYRQEGLAAAENIVDTVLGSLGTLDYAATVHNTYDYATWSETLTALTPDAPDHPFHAVIAGDRPVQPFMDRLPAETVSFSISGGMDLEPLYDFAWDTLDESGPFGTRLLDTWRGLQEGWEFDLREDLLGPLGAEMVSAEMAVDGRDAWVWMLSVEDEQAVSRQLDRLLDEVPAFLTEMAAEQPMLAMLSLRTLPPAHEDLPGFREVILGIAQARMICGVSDGWMVMADSAETVRLMQETAAGRHPDLSTNEQLVAAALLPDGPALSVSFTDHGDEAAAVAAVLRMMAMSGGMAAAAAPDPEVKQIITRIFGMLTRLAPVVEAIDFFDSSATCTTFDGRRWRTRSVTRYVPPIEQS